MRTFGRMVDPSASKEFIMDHVLGEFEWVDRIVRLVPPSHYKDFVVVDQHHELPWAFSDVSQFDKGCKFDAERD